MNGRDTAKAMRWLAGGIALVLGCMPRPAGGATNTWTGSGSWTNTSHWSLGHVPVAGEAVAVTGTVRMDAATPALASYRLAPGAVHTLAGWNTALRADDVSIEGTLDHDPNTAAAPDPGGEWVPDARIRIVCGDLTVAPGGRLLADERGFRGGSHYADGCGPGAGAAVTRAESASGADHGGISGKSFGRVYGDRFAPELPGSGAGGFGNSGADGHGGHGGGAILVEASGTVRLDGAVTANGGGNYNQSFVSGGGSGGSVFVACHRLEGAGRVEARGGPGGTHVWSSGGGGGGRIALVRCEDAAAGLTVDAGGGAARTNLWDGGTGTVARRAPPPSAPAASLRLRAGPAVPAERLEVLVVGDSNTELGHITGELARHYEERYGYFGSGYHSLAASVGLGGGYLPHVSITNVGAWQTYLMVDGAHHETAPYLSPDGTAVISSSPGAYTEVGFTGTGIDVYWLASPGAGTFSLRIDGALRHTLATAAGSREVRRTRVEDLAAGGHTMQARVESGTVTLLGFASRTAPEGRASTPRAAVHKWGRSWSKTVDHANIDPAVHDTALRLLDPSVVVFLLGTNDHNLSPFTPPETYRDHLVDLAGRVRTALPEALVLVVSTHQIQEFAGNNDRLRAYVAMLPDIAAASGAAAWSLTGWFGPWANNSAAGLFLDNLHVNAEGGAAIARRLARVILEERDARAAP